MLVEKNYAIYTSAVFAYKAHLRAYASHVYKNIFKVEDLDVFKVGKAFGFDMPPQVNISEYLQQPIFIV